MRLPSLKMKTLLLIVSFLALCLISPDRANIWQLKDQNLVKVNDFQELQSVSVVSFSSSADLDGDGKPECLVLAEDVLKITNCGGEVFWQSPASWLVKEAQITDLNRNGTPEATLVVWRPFQPWPIDRFLPSGGRIKDFHDQNGMSCHVILIGWARQGYNELWAGSALIRPVSQLLAVDLDGDGQQEMVALEGIYDALSSGGALSVWRWSGFGFSLIDKEEGGFRQINLIGNSVQNWVVTR